MEPSHGGTGHPLIRTLRDGSRRFGYSEAAILLRRIVEGEDVTRRRRGESVRFVSDHALSFPSAEAELREVGDDGAARMALSFLGVTGTMGVMPTHYAELVQQRLRAGDATLDRFLEIFQNRIGRLFLHAHLKQHFWLGFAWTLPAAADATALDRRASETGPFEEILYGLLGLSAPRMRERAGLRPLGILHYAGVLAQRPRSAVAISGVLADVFEVPAIIESFLGGWVEIPAGERSTLGAVGQAELGRTMYLGDRYFDAALGFRVRLGPMRLERLLGLLPGSPGASRLSSFVPFAVGPDEPFDYTLELDGDDVPEARLTNDDDAPQRLGHTLWLFSDDEGARCGRVESGPFRPAPTNHEAGAGRWSKSA